MIIPFLKKGFITLTLALLIVGCGDSDPENLGNHLPDVNIVQTDKTVKVGTTVSLSSVILDVDGDELTYKWKFSEKPSASKAILKNSDKLVKETSFVADVAGKYVVELTAKDTFDAVGSDSVTIIANEGCSSYSDIDDDIREDTVLDGCYNVKRIVNVTNEALLTIKAGSTLLFSENAGLRVSSEGRLKATGTAENPILFTGEKRIVGSWEGIAFRGSNYQENEIDHAIIEYAGGRYDTDGALQMIGNYGSDNRLKLSNTTLRHNKYYGFKFEERSIFGKFENITSTKNGKTAGIVDISVVDQLDTQSDFRGNLGEDYVTVEGSGVRKNATWNALSVPLNITNGIYVSNNALLTLNPRITLVVNSGQIIRVHNSGALKAVGTSKEPILLRGKEETAGYWYGLHFESSNSTNNRLEYLTLQHGGGGSDAGLDLDSRSESSFTRISVKHSTFSNNAGYGIYIDYDRYTKYNKDIDTVNTFINNEDGSVGRR